MATKHITRIKDTLANVVAGLDDGQSAVLTDQKNEHIHRAGSTFYFPAISKYTDNGTDFTYQDADFKDVTARGNMYCAEYFYHFGDEDTYMQFGDDAFYLLAGGLTVLSVVEDDTQDYVEFNAANADVDFIVNTTVANTLYCEGSSGSVGIGTAAPGSPLHISAVSSSPQLILERTTTATGKWGIGATSNECRFTDYVTGYDVVKFAGGSTAKATTDILTLTNAANAVDMDGTGTGILFNQYYYDAGTPAVADAARIACITETDWTSTASTQDARLSFQTAVDGVLTEHMSLYSTGQLFFADNKGIELGSEAGDADFAIHSNGTDVHLQAGNGAKIFMWGNGIEIVIDSDFIINNDSGDYDMIFKGCPTSDPAKAGAFWNSNGQVMISAG